MSTKFVLLTPSNQRGIILTADMTPVTIDLHTQARLDRLYETIDGYDELLSYDSNYLAQATTLWQPTLCPDICLLHPPDIWARGGLVGHWAGPGVASPTSG